MVAYLENNFVPEEPIETDEYICQRCTACCKWPGDVRVSDEEIMRIAEYLSIDYHEFMNKYVRIHSRRDGLSLIEKPNDECFFLEKGACILQEVKPQQCIDFPNKWNFPHWQSVCQAKRRSEL